MNNQQRFFAHTLLELRIHRSDGQSYEDLFTAVMTNRFPDFTPVDPYGNSGDRKNDGYIKPLGKYYQVYAPRDSASKAHESAKKALTDFEGLKKSWESIARIREFHFALNDKFRGSNPLLEEVLAQIERAHSLDS